MVKGDKKTLFKGILIPSLGALCFGAIGLSGTLAIFRGNANAPITINSSSN